MRRVSALLLLPILISLSWGNVASAAQGHAAVFPSVNGSFDHAPTITFPAVSAPTTLEDKVLHAGSGSKVVKGELLVANYVGQIWRGKVFDSSFTRAEPAAFPIGVGAVIPGWDKVLVGMRLGSRVLLVLPPSNAYGASGNSGAGITGKDTIVFVIDLISTYGKTVGGDPKATPVSSTPAGISVTGTLGKKPTVTIAKKTPQPKAVSLKVLDRGRGAKITAGLVVSQLVVTDWTGKIVQSTWTTGQPEGDPVGDPSNTSVLDKLIGVRIGSRVLLELPKGSQGGPYAVVLDIVAQPRGTSSQAK